MQYFYYSDSMATCELAVFKENRKPENSEKNFSQQGREPTTNSTHIWRQRQDSSLGHIGGGQVLSPLPHPCSPHKEQTLTLL